MRVLRGKEVILADLADPDGGVRGYNIQQCVLRGPAVLLMGDIPELAGLKTVEVGQDQQWPVFRAENCLLMFNVLEQIHLRYPKRQVMENACTICGHVYKPGDESWLIRHGHIDPYGIGRPDDEGAFYCADCWAEERHEA